MEPDQHQTLGCFPQKLHPGEFLTETLEPPRSTSKLLPEEDSAACLASTPLRGILWRGQVRVRGGRSGGPTLTPAFRHLSPVGTSPEGPLKDLYGASLGPCPG